MDADAARHVRSPRARSRDHGPGRALVRLTLALTACTALSAAVRGLGSTDAGTPASQSSEDEAKSAEVARLAALSRSDEEAAESLIELLLEVDERLSLGETVGTLLLIEVAQWASAIVQSPIPEGARFLDNESCLLLAERAADRVPIPATRSILLAKTARDLFLISGLPAARLDVIDKFERVLDLIPPPSPLMSALLLFEIGDLQRLEGKFTRALGALESAERLLPPMKDPPQPEIAGLYVRLATERGRIELEMGRPDMAWGHYARARELAQRMGGRVLREQQVNEVSFLLAVDDPQGAKQICDRLLDDEDLESTLRPHVLSKRGVAGLSLGRLHETGFAEAKIDIETALDAERSPNHVLTCRLRLAEIALETGALGDAETMLASVSQHLDLELSDPGPSPMLVAQFAALSARTARERGGRSAQRLAEDRARLSVAVRALQEDFKRLEPVEGGVGFLHYPNRAQPLGELISVEDELDENGRGAERALEHLIRSQMLGSLAREMGAGSPSLGQVRGALPEGGLLLAYLFAPDRSHLFVVDADEVTLFPLQGRLPFSLAFEGFFELMSERDPDARWERKAESLASDLARRLLPPEVIERLETSPRVTVVGADHLGVFPFEAMHLPSGEWLGSAVAIDHWPSLPVGVELARRAREQQGTQRSRHAGFLAPRIEHSNLTPLELSQTQRQAIETAWPGIELFTGCSASEARLRELDGSSLSTAVFLAHGISDPSRALPSGLALAPGNGQDGDLWFEEIRMLGGVPETVVLGVCGAGRGPMRLGEDGATHLGGVWIAAGSRCAVLSAFALEEDATRSLIVELGKALADGAAVPEAMRTARSAVAEQRSAPIYHQLVQVIGWNP